MVALIFHTGVGSRILKSERKKRINDVINRIGNIGIKLLKNGENALNIIEKIINILERSGEFNAGLGSVTQIDDIQRMDAGIMCSNLKCGGVAGVTDILYPISLARMIMEKTNCIYLIGRHATNFGLKNGIAKIPMDSYNLKNKEKSETVGAVVLDKSGMIAAGTSTGGLYHAIAGRMGDSPIIGAGIYANEFGGVSCTGIGEDIIRTTLARYAIFQLEQGKTAQEAADLAIKYFEKKTHSIAGVAILSSNGECGISHNGKHMNWKYLNMEG
ncbi:MAG: isoaspartyl peptidase/L-asparaginase [Candidatus Helarchaeota archaeon]